ncbi:hypothetical protein [Streptomyces xanthochromogenes]|uniref:hypothetical protein n=1 Tax=Streptomyces xanthochromogenes TaxID=67384 RepID=UPI002F40399A
MELLLIAACAWLVHTAGAQSEQSKMGLSPAQRDILRESTRHEKAVQRIVNRHGVESADSGVPSVPLTKKTSAPAGAQVLTLPEALRSGYRSHTPIERVATPVGRHAGRWAARGVAWAEDTGKGAVREYRKRRRAKGHPDPAPVLVPLPPAHPPAVPAMPTEPPTATVDSNKKPVSLKKPEPAPTGDAPTPVTPEPVAAVAEPPVAAEPETPTVPAAKPAPTVPAEAPAPAEPQPITDQQPADAGEGVGRMAAEVTYESVMDESDELSLMCDDDVAVYGRIGKRCEREIGRGDTLIAAMEAVGFGPKVIGWVARGKEQYQVINSQIDELKSNTVAQAETVVKAKALLEAGQGVYADIAKDMETVADRDVYISDAVDAEDASAHTEIYETKAA